MNLTLKTLDLDLSVMRFPVHEKFSADYINAPEFKNIIRADGECTLICETSLKPANTPEKCVDGWKAFKVQGPLDFSLVGILAALTAKLAEHQISVVALSTFDTDILLVSADKFDAARKALAERFNVGQE